MNAYRRMATRRARLAGDVLAIDRELIEAVELLEAGLQLRILGDLPVGMPMTQQEWDARCENFLRRMNKEEGEADNT